MIAEALVPKCKYWYCEDGKYNEAIFIRKRDTLIYPFEFNVLINNHYHCMTLSSVEIKNLIFKFRPVKNKPRIV